MKRMTNRRGGRRNAEFKNYQPTSASLCVPLRLTSDRTTENCCSSHNAYHSHREQQRPFVSDLSPYRIVPFAQSVRISRHAAGADGDGGNSQTDRDVRIGRSSVEDRG